MKEISFNCPECKAVGSVELEKRTITTTYIAIGKNNNKFYSLLGDTATGKHIPINNMYEQYVFVCAECSKEFIYIEAEVFDEENEELNKSKLKQLGLIR